MAWTSAALAAFLLLPAPQGTENPDEPKILSSSDVSSLNKKAKDWFEEWQKYEFEAESPRERQRAAKGLARAKEQFLKEWESRLRKGDILSSVADLRAIFANAFPYERQSTSGNVKFVKEGDFAPAHAFVAPRSYDPEEAYLTVISVPGWDDARNVWVPIQEWFDLTWAGSELSERTIFVIPQLDAGEQVLELDTPLDPMSPDSEGIENRRLRAVLGAAGQVQREFNIDRERLLLDCSRGSCAFGLRLASFFPDRFAGVILRAPVDVTKTMRLGSLAGLPVLMISSEDTKDACETLKETLEKLESGTVTVLEAKGDYPYPELTPDITAWIAAARRNLNRSRVVVEPNSDRFNDAYWVQVGTAEPLVNLALDQKPQLIAEADRENNRITVDARAVRDFTLMLNDELVDLSKPFTVVVNGTAMKEERERSLTFVVDRMQSRFDPSWVFVTEFATTVPAATTTGN